MPTTINASNTTGGAVVTGDGSGILELQSGGVTAVTINGANVTVAGTLTATGGLTALTSPVAVIGNSTAGAEIRLPEDTDNGSNYVAIKAPDSIASNLTLTLPSTDGASGQALITNGSGQLSFSSVSTAFTATASGSLTQNRGVMINSTGAAYAATYTASTAGTNLALRINLPVTDYKLASFAYDKNMNAAYGIMYNATAATDRPLGWYTFEITFNDQGQPIRTITGNMGYISTGVPNSTTDDLAVCVGVNPNTQTMLSFYSASATAVVYNLMSYGDQIYSGTRPSGAWTTISSTPYVYSVLADEQTDAWVLFRTDTSNLPQASRYTQGSSPDQKVLTSSGSIQLSSTAVTGSAFNACYDPVSKLMVVVYNNKIRTVDGTTSTPTLGTEQTYTSTTTTPSEANITYNSRLNIFQIAFRDASGFPRCILASLSGGTFTFGTEVTVQSTSYDYFFTAPDMYSDKMIYKYGDRYKFGSITGLNVSFGTESTFSQTMRKAFFAQGANCFVTYYEFQLSYAVMGSHNIKSSAPFVGVSDANYTNGQTATIKPNGTTVTGSGYTPGQKYYYGHDGSLVNFNTNFYAGRAISTTQILLGA